MDSIFIRAMEDFDHILLQSNCFRSILNIHFKSLMKYQLSGSPVRFLNDIYHKPQKTMTMNSKKFCLNSHTFSSGGSTANINENAVFDHPIMFKQKMVRHRRKSGVRKTMECLKRCLDNTAFSHVVKWNNKQKKIFSVLYKHRKSPEWSSKFLVFFKELDRNTKLEKYENQKDSESTGKQRCRANLKKLCEDGLLECMGEIKYDKCTREVYYKFTDTANNDEANLQTENGWIESPFINGDGDNFNNHFNEMALQTTNENSAGNYEYGENFQVSNMDNCLEALQTTNDNSAGNDENGENFQVSNMDNCLPDLQTTYENGVGNDDGEESEDYNMDNSSEASNSNESNFITDIDLSLNDFSSNLIPPVEESRDMNDLLDMIDDKVNRSANNDILWSKGCNPNINTGMNITQVVQTL